MMELVFKKVKDMVGKTRKCYSADFSSPKYLFKKSFFSGLLFNTRDYVSYNLLQDLPSEDDQTLECSLTHSHTTKLWSRPNLKHLQMTS